MENAALNRVDSLRDATAVFMCVRSSRQIGSRRKIFGFGAWRSIARLDRETGRKIKGTRKAKLSA